MGCWSLDSVSGPRRGPRETGDVQRPSVSRQVGFPLADLDGLGVGQRLSPPGQVGAVILLSSNSRGSKGIRELRGLASDRST